MVAKDFFPFATMSWLPWLRVTKRLISWNFWIKFPFFVKISKTWCLKCHIHGKIPQNLPLCNRQSWLQRENILCIHDSWLRRIFYPLQPWLTVVKRLIWKWADFWKHVFTYDFGQKVPISFLILQSRFPES